MTLLFVSQYGKKVSILIYTRKDAFTLFLDHLLVYYAFMNGTQIAYNISGSRLETPCVLCVSEQRPACPRGLFLFSMSQFRI